METNDTRPSIEALLKHAEWVRTVARRLVADESTADDIVQDSWLAALKRPPEHAGQLRGWLARVLSNKARERGRAESRRKFREERASKPEGGVSMDELAERAATQREVVGHVLALEEPFRSVVLLRFFEDQTPPEIAERLGIPLKTVHSRLQRAFEKLRAKLDAEYGEREAWCSALLPLANMAGPPLLPMGAAPAPAASTASTLAATTTGVWIMSTNAKLALAAALLLGGAWGLHDQGSVAGTKSPAGRVESEHAVSAQPRAEELESIDAEAIQLADQRESLLGSTLPEEPPEEVQAPDPNALTIRGRVVDVEGHPIPGIPVDAQSTSQQGQARTAGDGTFEVQCLPPTSGGVFEGVGTFSLRIKSPGWATVRESVVNSTNRDRSHVIVASRTVHAEGWVRDTDGFPIGGARVNSTPTARAFYGSNYVLDLSRQVDIGTSTDEAGHFSMEEFPDFSGAQLTVHAEGFLSRTVQLDRAAWPLPIELRRPVEDDIPTVNGIVLDNRGLAIEGAKVHLSTNVTTTDATGWFRLPLVDSQIANGTPLCATMNDHQAALIANYGKRLKSELPVLETVELRLGPAPLSIQGRVVDADGLPWPDWIVGVMNLTEISQYTVPMVSAEQFSGMGRNRVQTSEDGSFRIDGLFDRTYTIQAYDPETLQVAKAEFAGGESEAILQTKAGVPHLMKGRVVDSSGQPVEDVRLSVNLKIELIKNGSSSITGRSTTSDQNGEFEIEYVPHDRLFLTYSGEHILSDNLALDTRDEDELMVIVVPRRCHFRIELSEDWSAVDSVRFLDGNGEELSVYQFQAGRSSGFLVARLKDRQSQQHAISDAARTMVFLVDQKEVHRKPVQLTPDSFQVLGQ